MKPSHLFSILAIAVLPVAAVADPQTPHIAQACAGCHGQSGAGMGAIPDIAGYDRDAFIQVWEEFRAGKRFATIMTRIAPGYTDEEVATLADYFASLR